MPPKKGTFVEILHDTGSTLSSLHAYQQKWDTFMVNDSDDVETRRRIVWVWQEDTPVAVLNHRPGLRVLGKKPFIKYEYKQSQQLEKLYQRYKVSRDIDVLYRHYLIVEFDDQVACCNESAAINHNTAAAAASDFDLPHLMIGKRRLW